MSFRGYNQSGSSGPFIPCELRDLFETALLTLAGSEKIPKEFCGDEVFKKIRQKFNNAIGHNKSKMVIRSSVAPSVNHQCIYKYIKYNFFNRTRTNMNRLLQLQHRKQSKQRAGVKISLGHLHLLLELAPGGIKIQMLLVDHHGEM